MHLEWSDFRVPAKIEDFPELIVAHKDGVPIRQFWPDLVLVASQDDLDKLTIPGSDFLEDFVISGKTEKWKLTNPVVYGQNPSPVGGLVVFLVRADKYEFLSSGR